MRLPSLGDVATTAQHTARRFPLVLVAGILAAYAGVSLVDVAWRESELVRLLVTASLGLPLLFALTVLAERHARNPTDHWLILGAGVAVLAGFWFAWPGWTTVGQGARYTQLSAAFHLFAAFAPFIAYREPNAFWQYNKALFLRFLTAALYTGVLWLGLAGALLALDRLLGVSVAGEGYARLWIILTFVFNPWFFVAGVPEDLGGLEERTDYPAGLRVFTQYVLVPIVTIYLVILTIYLGKIVVTRQWPNGWIGYLVSSVASVGIFSWLLVHPLEERAEHAWVKTFTRGFHVALMPAIVMLWLAIWKRVAQYGITERRYFMVVLSLWLAGVAVYYTFSKSRSIKLIPATLCAIALLTFTGPWSAYAVSRRSQMGRLEVVLTRNGLLMDGALRASTRDLPDSDAAEISSGLRYLLETHGEASVRPWISSSPLVRTIGAVGGGNAERANAGARAIVTAMHVVYVVPGNNRAADSDYYSYYNEQPDRVVPIDGYAYAVQLSPGLLNDSLMIADGVYLRVTPDPLALVVTRVGARVLDVPFQPVLDSAQAYRRHTPAGNIPARLMTIDAHPKGGAVLVRLQQLGGYRSRPARVTSQPARVTSLAGEVFLRLPP